MQVNPEKYPSLFKGIRITMAEEGFRGLIKGWVPTAIGYSFQGAGKFGFYEVFKDMYSTMVGEHNAHQYRSFVYIAASGSAEFIADVLLCPWEMLKVCRSTKQGRKN
jgi:solute carrier family 25 phosphate transporter 3